MFRNKEKLAYSLSLDEMVFWVISMYFVVIVLVVSCIDNFFFQLKELKKTNVKKIT